MLKEVGLNTLTGTAAEITPIKSIDDNQPDTFNESYPYATGYSKSAMRQTQEDLQRVIDNIGAKDD